MQEVPKTKFYKFQDPDIDQDDGLECLGLEEVVHTKKSTSCEVAKVASVQAVRAMPFKKYRGRSSQKSKAREHKIEDAKKQKRREAMINGIMPNGEHHLGHGNNQ